MATKKSQELSERIPPGESEALLKKAQEQWMHENFRKRVLELVTEHEGTRAFEDAVSGIIARYIKIKTSERIFWLVAILVAGGIGYFLKP